MEIYIKNFVKILIGLVLGIYLGFITLKKDCSNQIIRINSYYEALDQLKTADKNTLVVFDVDNTLIMPKSSIMRTKTINQNQDWLNQTIDKFFKSTKIKNYYFHYRLKDEPYFVIEPIIINTINSLKKRGIMIIALTNMVTGSIYTIDSMPKWRYEKLKNLEIDFYNHDLQNKIFMNFPEKNSTYPMLYNGILVTNKESKGPILGAFLDYINWTPKKIIFFDDLIDELQSVSAEAKKRKISFLGYQYLGAEKFSGDINKKIVEIQFKFLLEQKKWLNDEEASKFL